MPYLIKPKEGVTTQFNIRHEGAYYFIQAGDPDHGELVLTDREYLLHRQAFLSFSHKLDIMSVKEQNLGNSEQQDNASSEPTYSDSTDAYTTTTAGNTNTVSEGSQNESPSDDAKSSSLHKSDDSGKTPEETTDFQPAPATGFFDQFTTRKGGKKK